MCGSQSDNPAETYEQYLGRAIAEPFTQLLLEYAAPQSGERALDVACGSGIVARQVAPLVGAAGKVVALDINPQMLEVARGLPAPSGAAIEWRQGDAVALPLPDDAFDLVLCQQGLQFFADRAASVREMRRVLASGGRVALSVWQSLERHPVYESLFEATAQHLGIAMADVALSFSLGDAEELAGLLGDAGFQQVEVTPHALDIRFPWPEQFVQFTVVGAATSVPAFAHVDASQRTALVEAVTQQTSAALEPYRADDALVFPMFTNIALAKR